MPPVARITATSRCFISSCVPSSVTVVIQLIAPRRRARAPRRLFHHFGDARDAFDGGRVRAEDDRAARLRARSGSCRWPSTSGWSTGTTAATTPNGSGDLDDAPIVVPGDDADGLHRPDEVVDLLRAEQVLLNLVCDDAVAGFLDGEPGKRLRPARSRRRPSRRRWRRCAPGRTRRARARPAWRGAPARGPPRSTRDRDRSEREPAGSATGC